MIGSLCISAEEFMGSLEKLFEVTKEDIEIIIRDFHSEMQKGLSGDNSSLKMIPAFVDRPRGSEKGTFIALDLGGTNVRVLAVELDGERRSTVLAESRFVIKKECMEATADLLFNFIADSVATFLADNNVDRTSCYDLAFTFSFPVEQTGIASGKLIQWTKGFTSRGVAGKDVIKLLDEALQRKGLTCLRVVALINDTVGTLVAKSYSDKHCDIGVVLGTGTNACYVEKVANMSAWKGNPPMDTMIVNTEWGNFNRLRTNDYDDKLDIESQNPGYQFLEKMISGMYLGEIARNVINDLVCRTFLFKEAHLRNTFERRGSFETSDMSIIADDDSSNLEIVEDFLVSRGIEQSTLADRQRLQKVCEYVSKRAARMSAAAIAGVITWMDPDLARDHTVGIDGSLFEKYPGFDEAMREVFADLFDEHAKKIKLEMAKDGSGKGAAIIAAVATSSNRT
jgi:hexokinase